MKKIFACTILILFLICFANTYSYAKYIENIEIEVANIELDRIRPKMIYQCWSTLNTYMTSEGKKYDLAFGMTIQEKNLAEDKINMEKVTTWVDDVETKLNIVVTETEHTEEEHKYTIEIFGITGEGHFRMEFAQGAVTDKAGWTNTLNVVDIQSAI